eukprot:13406617-Ditylum_brightwellii.AAC.1
MDTLDVVSLAVKDTDGKGLEVSNTKNMTKLQLQVPSSLNSARHMLNNLAALCAELTSNLSYLIQRIYSWVAFFNHHKERLTHLGAKDHEFYTKVLYLVDTAKEAFLQECHEGHINKDLISFETLKAQILSRQYFITLPPVLKALTSTLHQPSPTHTPHAKPTPKSSQLTNKQGNRNWFVPQSEYKKLIHDNVIGGHIQPPIWNRASNKPVCMHWHFKHICTSNCPHVATHTQPT